MDDAECLVCASDMPWHECPACCGTGEVESDDWEDYGEWVACQECNGRGGRWVCPVCAAEEGSDE